MFHSTKPPRSCAIPLADHLPDPDHSIEEERWVVIGETNVGRLLVVCYLDDSDVIRIFSAREPTRTEARRYRDRR
jgi:uncharacterized DUF497 family protein